MASNSSPSMIISGNSSMSAAARNPGPHTAARQTTKTTTSTTIVKRVSSSISPEALPARAQVEELGQKANLSSAKLSTNARLAREEVKTESGKRVNDGSVEGNKLVTSISTIAAQSGRSRIVLALLKDGDGLQLKIQEMRAAIFEVGPNYKECVRYFEDHQKLVNNLRKLRKSPVEEWLQKYNQIKSYKEPSMSDERKLVYMCMLENLQACWKGLLGQLERRTNVLKEASKFYEFCEQLARALDQADKHVQLSRNLFLNGPTSGTANHFKEAFAELKALNQTVLEQYNLARAQQRRLIQLIQLIAGENLGDSRPAKLEEEARQLIAYIESYLEPLERRRLQLEGVISTTSKITTTTTTTTTASATKTPADNSTGRTDSSSTNRTSQFGDEQAGSGKQWRQIREIGNFSDLDLAENWLNLKIEQLNSSLLSSLGVSVPDSRSILAKHEQIALECGAIEEATLNFNGKNIHAIKQLDSRDDKFQGDKSLFEQQKLLAERARDVITILDVRIVLLRRTIDFYIRSKEATIDIGKLMRRLQVDNSLQSVEFVANELESKDVSSVVASGATILSELQQLQLAQQHGQRSRIINLNLVTLGIRSIIDQLNRDLAHLKTVSNQRKLVLLNEDTNKMVNNFTNKCHQLHQWLNNQAKVFLQDNNRLVVVEGLGYTIQQLRGFCENHELLRVKLQNKTLEVEALLRSLPSLTENFDSKSKTSDQVQQLTDELRHDWIHVTNCFDKRLELAKRYLSILQLYHALDRELVTLERFNTGRSIAPDERTDEEIRSNIDQLFLQLSNQIKNFNLDAQKSNTELVYSEDAIKSSGSKNKLLKNDINKKQVVDYVNNLLGTFDLKYKRALRPFERAAPTSGRAANLQAEPVYSNLPNVTTSTTIETELTNEKTTRFKQQPQRKPPAHQRPQQVDPPRFTRLLQDKSVEPFSQVELECETDTNSRDFQIEWFMNNFKRIPASIKHSVVSENNQHKLIIYNFSPICCGTYQVRASNQAGQALSQCRLKLSGIKEDEVELGLASCYGGSSNNFAQWPPATNARQQLPVGNNPMARIIQGVESPGGSSQGTASNRNWRHESTLKITQVSSSCDSNSEQPGSQVLYSGPLQSSASSASQQPAQMQLQAETNNHLTVPGGYAGSSPVSSATLESRSVSRSPFEGTPQPPVFTQALAPEARCGSRTGIVCVVVGNPAPKIEWLHNDKTIAVTRAPRNPELANQSNQKGSLCKLVIETNNPNTQGHYVCRASNRIGQTSTAISLGGK